MNRSLFSGILLFAVVLVSAIDAHATDISAINTNIATSVSNMPTLIAGMCYLLGLILGAMGIVKMKQHVEDARSTPLKEPIIRFLAGGALLALPAVYNAAITTIGIVPLSDFQGAARGRMLLGAAVTNGNINQILRNIMTSLTNTPGLLTGVAYLLGLTLGVSGVLQLKDHVQSPEQGPPLRSGIIRLVSCGSLLALPTILQAVFTSFTGAGSTFTHLDFLVGNIGTSGEAPGAGCGPAAAGVNAVICNLYNGAASFPVFLVGAAYLFGIVFVIWGIIKIKEHVLDPSRTTVWEGVSRLAAGGAMFALPTVLDAVIGTMSTIIPAHNNTGFTGVAAALGLDRMMANFVTAIFGPLDILINFFGYVAGAVLIMIGISRLLKSSQEGVRGPGGIGTIMTFLTGGALLSFSPMISAFTMSLFNGPTTTNAALVYTVGLAPDEIAHIHAVISAILKFVLVLGLISFMRGIFIIRSVAEGNQQASMMAGVTHLIGGALAVNLGPFLNVNFT